LDRCELPSCSSKLIVQSGNIFLCLSERKVTSIDPESKVILFIGQYSIVFLQLGIDLIDPLELIAQKGTLGMKFGKFLLQLSNNVNFVVKFSNNLLFIALGNGHDVDLVFEFVHSFLLLLNVVLGSLQSAVGVFVLLVAQFHLLFQGENALSQYVQFLLQLGAS
jgi:hypothetical protein